MAEEMEPPGPALCSMHPDDQWGCRLRPWKCEGANEKDTVGFEAQVLADHALRIMVHIPQSDDVVGRSAAFEHRPLERIWNAAVATNDNWWRPEQGRNAHQGYSGD